MTDFQMLYFLKNLDSTNIKHPHIEWVKSLGGRIFEIQFSNRQSIKTVDTAFNLQDLGMCLFLQTCARFPQRKFEFNGPNPFNPHRLIPKYSHTAFEAISRVVCVDRIKWALIELGPYAGLRDMLQHIQRIGCLDCEFVARDVYDIMDRISKTGRFLVLSRSHVFSVIDGMVSCQTTYVGFPVPQVTWATRHLLGLTAITKIYEVVPFIRKPKTNKRARIFSESTAS